MATSVPAPSSVNTSNNVYDAINGKKTTTNKADETQDRFLKLLIQQLKSQDPMNPMDSAESTSQMAQINTVSGIEKLNATMNDVAKSFSAGQSYQAAALIGRSVLVAGNSMPLANGKATAEVDIPEGTGAVTVSIYDKNNNKVDEFKMSGEKTGRQAIEWDGKNTAGVAMADGNYVVSAVATQGDSSTAPLTTYTFAKVASVAVAADGIKVKLADLREVPFADVSQIS